MVFVSIWASIAAWFTPTVLFCLTNFIIVTIFIASNNKHHNHNHGDSLLTTPYPTPPKTAAYGPSSRLAQSIHSSSNYPTPIEPSNRTESQPTQSELSSSTSVKLNELGPPNSLLERVKSIKFSSFYTNNIFQNESELISNSPGQLSRSPSFLDRVKSFKIYKFGPASTPPENMDTDPDHHVIRSKSDTANKKSVAEMKKSRSDTRMAAPDDEDDIDLRRPATARESRKWNVADEEVDAKADDFITRFKQQLKLQRIESLVRYNKRLNGGA